MEQENENDDVMAMAQVVNDDEARVNITWNGQNGDLPDPVLFDATDGDIRGWVTEALRGGSVPGIDADAEADLTDFNVERFAPNDARPFALIQIRPKTAFGA